MTLNGAAPVWLDVTRLLSRVGRGVVTGIDRVELAYLDRFLGESDGATRYLCRTTRGFLLLDAAGGHRLAALLRGTEPLGSADLFSKVIGRGARPRHRAEAMLRRFAVDRCRVRALSAMIARSGPVQTYINTGHANLSERTLPVFRHAGVTTAVMVHDLIPLNHPDTVVPDQPPKFAARIDRVRRYADLVICNSAATRDALTDHWSGTASVPQTEVAHLGLTPLPSARTAARKDPKSFVMLGTIEARKNHALMLDVWDILSARMGEGDLPHLHIIGPRGWRVESLLARLERHPLRGKAIFEHGPLPEDETRQRIAEASALVFPSIAEGYGYPPLEALALGTRPLVSDLPVLREILDKQAVYLPVNDAYCWAETIMQRLSGSVDQPDGAQFKLPTWQTHFSTVADALQKVRKRQGPPDEGGETLRTAP